MPFERNTFKNIYIDTETYRRKVRCKCLSGHVFSARIHVVVNTDTDPDAIRRISSTGQQDARCPVCAEQRTLAEPVCLHDPERKRFALFIPDVLVHRELELRAALAAEVASCDPDYVPEYFTRYECLVGVRELATWLGMGRKASVGAVSSDKEAYPQAMEQLKDPRPKSAAVDRDRRRPKIHEAFADLANSESAPPPAPESYRGDGTDGLEAGSLAYDDEDWNDREAQQSAMSDEVGSGESTKRKNATKTAAPETSRQNRSPGSRHEKPARAEVDFSGMLTDDDGDG